MRNIIYIFILGVLVSISYSQISQAVCEVNGSTADGGNIINCPAPVQNTAISTTSAVATTNFADILNIFPGGGVEINSGGAAVNTSGGDDVINVSGQIVHNNNNTALATGGGNDKVFVNPGGLISTGSALAIGLSSGEGFIQVNGGTVNGRIRGTNDSNTIELIDGAITGFIDLLGGEDVVRILGGTFDGVIEADEGNDTVILSGGTFITPADILLSNDDDSLTIANDFDINIIACGPGFDTLTFAMEVSENLLLVAREIEQANPSGDSITINGFNYQWSGCERLVDDLRGDRDSVRPIPTLSEWGLIAMAVALGILAVYSVRKRHIRA